MALEPTRPLKVCLCGGMKGPCPPGRFDAETAAFADSLPAGTSVVYGGVTTGLVGRVALALAERGVILEGALTPEEMTDKCDKLAQVYFFDSYDERQGYMFSVVSSVYFLPGGLGTFHELFSLLLKNKELREPRKVILLNWGGYWTSVKQLLSQAEESGFLKSEDLKALQWSEGGAN